MLRRLREVRAGIVVIACLCGFSAATLADLKLSSDLAGQLTQDLLETDELLARERARNAALAQALSAPDASGIRRQYRSRVVQELTPQTAAMKALARNLTIQSSDLNARSARAALIEAEAVFDPVLSMSANYSENQNLDRIEGIVDKAKSGTVAVDTNGDGVIDDHRVLLPGGGPIEFISFNKPRPEGLYPTTEVASEADITGPDTDYTYDVTIAQALSWGKEFSISLTLVDKERFFVNEEGASRAGLASIGTFGREWAAAVSGSLFTPLPGTKDFGAFANRETSVKIAEIRRDQALDITRQTINDTLLDVDTRFYELTFAALDLEITHANQAQVERLVEKTDRLFDARTITARGKAQARAELERVKAEVERAWDRYIRASNALNELLDEDETLMFMPVGYSTTFRNSVRVDYADGSSLDAKNNPEYAVQDRELAVAEVLKHNAELNAKPDLGLTLSATSTQAGSGGRTFGHDFGNAIINIVEPDRVSFNAGVNLFRPWGNRAARAGQVDADLGHQAQELLLRDTLNGINQQLDDALVELNSAGARVSITQRNLELARTRYEKAVDGQTRRGTTEFEIVTQSRALLDANRDWIRALTDQKIRESRVLAATGLLAQTYGERTAMTELDRQRIDLLASRHRFQYFGDEQ